MLKDGRFFIAGGEYLTGYNLTPPTETNHAALEIYDPVANVWARQPDSPLGGIGDVAYQILTDGRILMGYRFGAQVEIFNPATGTWSTGPNKGAGSSTEERWSLLPNGTVSGTRAVQQLAVALETVTRGPNEAVDPHHRLRPPLRRARTHIPTYRSDQARHSPRRPRTARRETARRHTPCPRRAGREGSGP